MMKKTALLLFFVIAIFTLSFTNSPAGVIATGQQPQIAVDSKGTVRVVYGDGDKIFCATSADGGANFAAPVLVAAVPNMHLGMSRGPQVATSANYTVITEVDKAGTIHWYRLSHATGKWSNMGVVNDKKGSAPEGLMSIAADKADNFYAVWLDIRTGGNNQIYFSALPAKATTWTKNMMAYQSPDGHVCECCKPNIAVKDGEVVLMFRNWLMGSRDLYVVKSTNSGKSFGSAQKLGTDTWKMNACTMDGGGITIGNKGNIYTTWQRKGDVYLAQPGQPETRIAKGRTCDITGPEDNLVLTYQNNDTVKMVSLKTKKITTVDKGAFLQTAVLAGNKTLCVWEQGSLVKFRVL